jgi:hypothetical protein
MSVKFNSVAYTDCSLWKATKRLKQPTQRIPPIRRVDQTRARSNREKGEQFSKALRHSNQTEINKALKAHYK